MNEPASCSSVSLALGEPLAATAPAALGWVLVEQKGAWGAKPLTSSGLDPEIGAEIERRAKQLGLKALLVKPPGRDPSHGRSVFLSSSLPGSSFIEELEVEDPSDLLDLDLTPLARGERTGVGTVASEPLYLVCTNGKRDACCARLGRSVARSLAALRPARVWECSHLGGHRFAANVVCLPEGLCYGRVRDGSAAAIVAEHEAGRVVLELLRGRSSQAPEVQAAEHLVREHERIPAIDGLRMHEARDGLVVLRDQTGGLHAVRVVRQEAGVARITSCNAETTDRPAIWDVSLTGPETPEP